MGFFKKDKGSKPAKIKAPKEVKDVDNALAKDMKEVESAIKDVTKKYRMLKRAQKGLAGAVVAAAFFKKTNTKFYRFLEKALGAVNSILDTVQDLDPDKSKVTAVSKQAASAAKAVLKEKAVEKKMNLCINLRHDVTKLENKLENFKQNVSVVSKGTGTITKKIKETIKALEAEKNQSKAIDMCVDSIVKRLKALDNSVNQNAVVVISKKVEGSMLKPVRILKRKLSKAEQVLRNFEDDAKNGILA